MTINRLENIALNYCQRYLVSRKKLETYLETRIFREVVDEEARQNFLVHIPNIAARMSDLGFSNDLEAASAKLRSNLRSGYSPSAAVRRSAMAAKVKSETVEELLPTAIMEIVQTDENYSLDSVHEEYNLARIALERWRRGPFRGAGRSDKTDRRDIAWLLRRGFGYEQICRAMDVDPENVLEDKNPRNTL